MKQEVHAKCLSCFHEQRWVVEHNEILSREVWVDGGSRKPQKHPHLSAWEQIKTFRNEGVWKVIEPCPKCGMPFAARQSLQVAMEWPLPCGDITYFCGPEKNTGPDGLISDDDLEQHLKDAYGERFDASTLVDPTRWFQLISFTVFAAIFVAWALGAFCLFNFYMAIYQQGFDGMP